MDILFVSSKGAQYRYFKSLCQDLSLKCGLSTLRPSYRLSLVSSGLTSSMVRRGIAFHVQRKQKKHTLLSRFPKIFWRLYWLASAIRFAVIYFRFTRYFKVCKPKLVALWNGHRLPEEAVNAAAKKFGIRVVYFENGLLPNTTTMDFSGVNAFSSVPREQEFYLKRMGLVGARSFLSVPLVARAPHKKKKIVRSEKLDCRYVFVPFQVGFDSQVLINSPRVQSMEALYSILESTLCDVSDTDLIFVVKEHPSDPRCYEDLYNKNSKILFSSLPTEELIKGAEAIVTLNSSVGLEAIMLEKKVFVLGEACFAVEGVAWPVIGSLELAFYISNLDSISVCPGLQRSFMAYLVDEYCIPGAWQEQCCAGLNAHVFVIEERILDYINFCVGEGASIRSCP